MVPQIGRLPTPFWYLITPDGSDDSLWRTQVAAALAARPSWVQYRNKKAEPALARRQAEWLCTEATALGVTVVINDDWELAAALGVGVHLGRNDAPVALVRARLGEQTLIGASCYADFALAKRQVAEGASYIAFGAVFPSPTKPDAVRAPLALFGEAAALGVPRVAIGGITLERVPELIAAGADGVAVIHDLFGLLDPEAVAARAAAWRAMFDRLTQGVADDRE